MIEIWQECAIFQTISQGLAEQVRMIIKEGWFSDLEILEIHQQINRESSQQDPNTIIDILKNTEKNKTLLTELNSKVITIEMNKGSQQIDIPKWITKGKSTLIQKDLQKEQSQQLQTYNVLTADVENTNGTNQGDLIFANKLRTVPRRTDRDKRNTDRHILKESKTRREKCSNGVG